VPSAANKEHQQIMAELRMLQEQQAQLQQMIHGLGETLKVVTTRLDDQSTVSRKAFAD
jgi:prefoldin subunit 5